MRCDLSDRILPRDRPPDVRIHQLSMFKAIAAYDQEPSVNPDAQDSVDPDIIHLRRLASRFLWRTNKAAALLCLDHVFSRTPSLQKATLMETESLLSLYLTYVRLLDRFWRDIQPSEGSDCQKIFAFEVQQEGHYLVPARTLIHWNASATKGILEDPPLEYIFSREELERIISTTILDRIKIRVEMQERACRGTRGFSPCLNTLIRRNCFNEDCQFQHIPPNEITLDWFHARLRFLFLEFQILHLAQIFDKGVMQYVNLGLSFHLHSFNDKVLASNVLFCTLSADSKARFTQQPRTPKNPGWRAEHAYSTGVDVVCLQGPQHDPPALIVGVQRLLRI